MRFTTAEALLDFLSPRAAHWREQRSHWIFRGQSEDWAIKPKAHRDGPWFEEHGLPFGAAVQVAERHWLGDSEELLKQFARELDRAGLPIPSPAPKLFGERNRRFVPEEPLDDALPTLALAQHHGLPTPFLDWSFQATSAAYFACADLVWDRKPIVGSTTTAPPLYDERVDKPGELVVWCMDARVDQLRRQRGHEADAVWLTLEAAPRSGNARLHAQSGLFTWIHGEHAHERSVDQLIKSLIPTEASDLFGMIFPIMYKLTLDRPSQAHRLLKLLLDEGVSASSIMPGADGVVQTMRERAWCEHRRVLRVIHDEFVVSRSGSS